MKSFCCVLPAAAFPTAAFSDCRDRAADPLRNEHGSILFLSGCQLSGVSMAEKHTKTSVIVFTIGHSTHSIEEFVDILKAHGVELVIDIRTIPKSRHNPQYNSDTLASVLQGYAIGYEHLPGLGGLRHAKKDSINTAWENASFRGFADYMQTEVFEQSLDTLIEMAEKQPLAVMCAEAVPWRCHRSLIADALLVREITVMDIMSKALAQAHMMTPWAHVRGTTITYPKSESAGSAHASHPKRSKGSPL